MKASLCDVCKSIIPVRDQQEYTQYRPKQELPEKFRGISAVDVGFFGRYSDGGIQDICRECLAELTALILKDHIK
jgi:hypothetical protein